MNPNYKYRFDFILTDLEKEYKYEKLFISSYTLDGKFIEEIPLDQYIQDAAIINDTSTHSLTIASIDKRVDPLKTFSNGSIQVLNKIKNVYAHSGRILFFISLGIHLVLLIMTVVKSIKNKKLSPEFDIWIISAGILLSMLLVTAGVAYTGLTACYTFMYLYLAVTFPLLVMFIALDIGYIVDCILSLLTYHLKSSEQKQ